MILAHAFYEFVVEFEYNFFFRFFWLIIYFFNLKTIMLYYTYWKIFGSNKKFLYFF